MFCVFRSLPPPEMRSWRQSYAANVFPRNCSGFIKEQLIDILLVLCFSLTSFARLLSLWKEWVGGAIQKRKSRQPQIYPIVLIHAQEFLKLLGPWVLLIVNDSPSHFWFSRSLIIACLISLHCNDLHDTLLDSHLNLQAMAEAAYPASALCILLLKHPTPLELIFTHPKWFSLSPTDFHPAPLCT